MGQERPLQHALCRCALNSVLLVLLARPAHVPAPAGALLRDVLAQAGIKLDELDKAGKADKLHVHFESSQECEEDSYYGASLPLRMALCVPSSPFLSFTVSRTADEASSAPTQGP